MVKNSADNEYFLEEEVGFGKSILLFFLELVKIVLISLVIIVPVRYFLIQPFYVKGASMEPNFYDHEYLVICEICYSFDREPIRGDIVVFHYPKDPSQYFIKRVIGLPGEKVEIRGGKVYIYNDEYKAGKQLDENLYLDSAVATTNDQAVTMRAEEYFLMGDNREHSFDSRVFGPVPRHYIVGRTWLRGWPFDRVTIFDSPLYNL